MLVLGLVGLAAGSFIGAVVTRFGSGESALAGRSRCDGCATPLKAANLIPLISYAIQGGKARCCGARIDPLHPLAEASGLLIGGVAGMLPLPQAIAGAGLGWLLLTLALVDYRYFRLPDAAVALLAAAGVAASLILAVPPMLDAAIGAVVGFASLALIRLFYRTVRRREGIGGGDPKLFAAIGVWLGWEPLPTVLLAAAGIGLVVAGARWLVRRDIGWSDRVPLGTLLAVAAWPVWLWSFGLTTG